MSGGPELLAPAGSWEALTAAVRCGADAVYFGVGKFHARQAVGEEIPLEEAVSYCHARGVKVHLALNTLVREGEFERALEIARRAAACGADALILQDRGLARAVAGLYPDMPLHASTQLSCHTAAGVKELAACGFRRVILAREMSEREIAACCATGVETEVFLHGAMCVSVSGQCLLSAALGGRSGNRGRCAQPCRLPFASGKSPSPSDRALSLKDLSLIPHLPRLAGMGVTSLKIEGRLKRPEYVAAAVTAARQTLDEGQANPHIASLLAAVFSRSGFTDGAFTGERTAGMFGARTREDVEAAPPALKQLAALYRAERAAVPLDMTLTARPGRPATLTVSDRQGHTVSVCGGEARESASPSAPEKIASQLKKLGGTPFFAGDVTVDAEGVFLPASALNALRREAAERMLALRGAPAPYGTHALPPDDPLAPFPAVPALVARLSDEGQWSEELASRCAVVSLPLTVSGEALARAQRAGETAAEIPRGLFGREEACLSRLVRLKSEGVRAAFCHTADAVALCREAGMVPLGGFGLYAANRQAVAAYREEGLAAVTLSPELSLRQMAFGKNSSLPCGALMYGRLPLMLLRTCPHAVREGCGGCPSVRGGFGGWRSLTDRRGVRFPLACTGDCPDLLNSVPLYLADRSASFPALAFWTLYFTDEAPGKAAEIAEAYRAAARGLPAPAPRGAFTRGFSARGVE